MANDLFQSAAYKEKEPKTVRIDLAQSPGRYDWLKEVEVSEPIHLQELRNHSRMFLEKVKASRRASYPVVRRQTEKYREPTKPVVRSTSQPLPSNMHAQQEEKSLGRDDTNEERDESQASGDEWWKELEVKLPTYFLKRKQERTLVENVRGSRGNGQDKE